LCQRRPAAHFSASSRAGNSADHVRYPSEIRHARDIRCCLSLLAARKMREVLRGAFQLPKSDMFGSVQGKESDLIIFDCGLESRCQIAGLRFGEQPHDMHRYRESKQAMFPAGSVLDFYSMRGYEPMRGPCIGIKDTSACLLIRLCLIRIRGQPATTAAEVISANIAHCLALGRSETEQRRLGPIW
jgi:hypothetical protein